MAKATEETCCAGSGDSDEFLDETDDLPVCGFCDATDLFKNNAVLYGGDRVCSNLALYLQNSLLKIARGETCRIFMSPGTAGNGTYKEVRMPSVIDIIRQDEHRSNFGPYEI